MTVNMNLLSLVREMRTQRVAMVQTKEQYILLYQAVKQLFKERLSLIDSHPYENVSSDGNPISPSQTESDYEELYVQSGGKFIVFILNKILSMDFLFRFI